MRIHQALLSALALFPLSLAACGDDGGAAVDASTIDAPVPAGTFSLGWTISDGSATITCDDVGAVSLSVSVVEQSAGSGSVDAFTCAGGQATSRQFPPGTYDMTIDLRASGSRSLIDSPVQVRDIVITDGAVTALPDQVFTVVPTGGFSFSINSLASAGNCETVANSGAEIVGFEFVLEDKDGNCVDAAFNIDSGASSYTNNCTTPEAAHGCIDADKVISVNPFASGPYVLKVNGQITGPFDCYSRVSSFTVAGANLQTELGSLGMTLKYSKDCDPNFIEIDAGVPDATP